MSTFENPENQREEDPRDLRISEHGPAIPKLCLIIIAVNVLVFLFIQLRFGGADADFYAAYGGMYPPAIESGEWWRLITCTFLHANSFHLFNNMVMLFAAGAFVEDALKKAKFLVLYFGAGFFASLTSYLTSRSTHMVSIGASGAIFGVVGALVWIILRNRGHYQRLSFRGMLFMLALCVYYGFSSGGLIDNAAHIGGLISGFLLSILLYRLPGTASPKRAS